jgi:hypothetical protein
LIFLALPHKSLAGREHKDITSNRCKICITPKEKSEDWTHVFTEEKHMIMCIKKLLNPTHNRPASMLIFCPSSPTRKLSNGNYATEKQIIKSYIQEIQKKYPADMIRIKFIASSN